MGRPLRIHAPGAMYHITIRGNHRQDIFFTAGDRLRMSDLFAEGLGRYHARLHAYCYMPNHVHALIQVSDAPLGHLVMFVAGQYARITQARLETTGHLFEKRYYPVLVDIDEYLLTLMRYVHLNPVRARMVNSPDAFPWSSHHVYAGSRAEPWVTTELALSLFSSDPARAETAYLQFVADGVSNPPPRSPLEDCNPNDKRVLGSDDFARRVLGSKWTPRSRQTLDSLIEQACANFNCTIRELASVSRVKNLVVARAWITNQAVSARIASIAEVARKLNRHESSLRHALKAHILAP